MVADLSQLTFVTAVYGRKEDLIRNILAFNIAMIGLDCIPTRLFVFSENSKLGMGEFNDILKKYHNNPAVIKIIEMQPSGIYPALNLGVRNTATKFLTFYHSDDCLTPVAMAALASSVFSKNTINTYTVVHREMLSTPRLDQTFPYGRIGINHMASVFCTETHKQHEFDESLKFSADWMSIIKMQESGIKFRVHEACTVLFKEDGASTAINIQRLKEDLKILFLSIRKNKNPLFCMLRAAKEVAGHYLRRLGYGG